MFCTLIQDAEIIYLRFHTKINSNIKRIGEHDNRWRDIMSKRGNFAGDQKALVCVSCVYCIHMSIIYILSDIGLVPCNLSLCVLSLRSCSKKWYVSFGLVFPCTKLQTLFVYFYNKNDSLLRVCASVFYFPASSSSQG